MERWKMEKEVKQKNRKDHSLLLCFLQYCYLFKKKQSMLCISVSLHPLTPHLSETAQMCPFPFSMANRARLQRLVYFQEYCKNQIMREVIRSANALGNPLDSWVVVSKLFEAQACGVSASVTAAFICLSWFFSVCFEILVSSNRTRVGY